MPFNKGFSLQKGGFEYGAQVTKQVDKYQNNPSCTNIGCLINSNNNLKIYGHFHYFEIFGGWREYQAELHS